MTNHNIHTNYPTIHYYFFSCIIIKIMFSLNFKEQQGGNDYKIKISCGLMGHIYVVKVKF